MGLARLYDPQFNKNPATSYAMKQQKTALLQIKKSKNTLLASLKTGIRDYFCRRYPEAKENFPPGLSISGECHFGKHERT
ncbi:MAG: hypothetical protein U5L09_20625 [Bacteroidales bacterium]|nr:hypothetical protein [Bacteroidales bacterium]